MDRRLVAGLGVGMAAAASVAVLTWPTKNRKRKMAMRTLSRVADDVSGVLRFM